MSHSKLGEGWTFRHRLLNLRGFAIQLLSASSGESLAQEDSRESGRQAGEGWLRRNAGLLSPSQPPGQMQPLTEDSPAEEGHTAVHPTCVTAKCTFLTSGLAG